MAYRSSWMTDELTQFRKSFRQFLTSELAPRAKNWRDQKRVDRGAWRALGRSVYGNGRTDAHAIRG